MTIRLKVLIAIFTAILLVAGTGIFIVRTVGRSTIEDQVSDLLITTARSRYEHIETVLNQKAEITETAAQALLGAVSDRSLAPTGSWEPEFLNPILGLLRGSKQSFQDTMIWNADGSLVATSREGGGTGIDTEITEIIEGGVIGTYISDCYIDEDSGNTVMVVATPLGFGSQHVATLGIVHKVNDLFTVTTEREGLGETGEVYIVNGDGYMITPSRFLDDVVLQKQINIDEISSSLGLSRDSTVGDVALYNNYMGSEVISTGIMIPSMDWIVVAEKHTDEAFSPVRDLTSAMGWTVLGMLVLTVCIALLLSRTITAPILRLHRGAEELAAGNLDYRIGTTSKDEVGKLSRAFDRMADSLKASTDELEQRVLERTEQLETANKDLEAFSYSVSHDLRAPLRSIDGFSQVLLEDYSDQLDDQAKGYLDRMHQASLHMNQIIEGMVKLSGLARGELTYTQVDLSTMAVQIFDELQLGYPERKVEFIVDSGLVVDGDAELLQSVVDNLISNAWKFTSKKEDARIEFGFTDSTSKPAYFVRDNGAGFDMAEADKLFDTFKRLHANSEFEGTGIGLATVKRIINRHGGDIWAESVVDQGATFYFTL